MLLLGHQDIPSCDDCQTWLYDEKWKRATRGGKDLRRPPGVSTPCWKCPKSEDKKTPNPDAELSDRGYAALQAYYQIKAGRPMPDDDLTVWYCGMLCWTIDRVQQHQQNVAPLLGALLGGTAQRK